MLHFHFPFPDEIKQTFLFSGPLVVDWPHKSETNDLSPPKGESRVVIYLRCEVQSEFGTKAIQYCQSSALLLYCWYCNALLSLCAV